MEHEQLWLAKAPQPLARHLPCCTAGTKNRHKLQASKLRLPELKLEYKIFCFKLKKPSDTVLATFFNELPSVLEAKVS